MLHKMLFVCCCFILDSSESDLPIHLRQLDPGTLKNLRHKLRLDRQEIIKRYGSYVDCIRWSIIKQGVTLKDLRASLLCLSAFSNSNQEDMLLADSKIEEAVEINDIFVILEKDYSSFLNYEIFQTLQEKFVQNKDQEELRYPDHLKTYIKKHNIEEFIEMKPVPGKATNTSEILVLKLDLKETSKLSKLKELESEIAKILGITPLGLQLLDIEKGCVIVRFVVLNSIARFIFTGDEHKIFTPEQRGSFQTLRIQWLKFKHYRWNFLQDQEEMQSKISGNITC